MCVVRKLYNGDDTNNKDLHTGVLPVKLVEQSLGRTWAGKLAQE